jgi:magnesium transporter
MRVWSNIDGRWAEGEREGGLRWYDLTKADEPELQQLAGRYGLHPLAISDCLSSYLHAPKLEEFADYLFIVMIVPTADSDALEADELDVFLGRDYLITYHDEPGSPAAIDAVSAALEQGIVCRPGPDGLLHEVADRSVTAFFPAVTRIGEQLDSIEDAILIGGKTQSDHRRVLSFRAMAGRLRRLFAPELQYLLRLGRGEFEVVREENRPYFRDVYDHLLRVDLALEELREDTEVALSSYLGVLNNRLNEVMKVLAIVSALALPGTVITGVFGTNFDNVPGLHSNWGFALMTAAIIGVAVGMGAFFKRRGWF